jgi:hypothetical protein
MARFRSAFLAALFVVPTLAWAEGPAVSNPNGKLSVEGGQYDGDQSALALGSFTLPLGHAFGLQADGALGRVDEDTMGGGGVHLFTRDPSSYLLGVYGSYHTWNEVNIWRAAAEFQFYIRRFSLDGLAGYESVDFPTTSSGLTVLNSDSDHFFTHVDLAYYPIDDLKLYGGYRYVDDTSLGGAGIEYLMRAFDSPVSLFAKADFGDDQYNRITGGLKFYFGSSSQKSLIQRHRTEDPENYTPMFPTVRTSSSALPQCSLDPDFIVTSPANGQCICPAGTVQAGGSPVFLGGAYHCETI